MTGAAAHIHSAVLENQADGVLAVERGGTVSVLNAAAERILGMPGDEAVGQTFADLFLDRDGLEAFSELVLDAVAGGSETERRLVEIAVGGEQRLLSVATSYIRELVDGAPEPVALIAVFSDISEVERLRETELRMAKQVEAQHDELQTAYRQLDERSRTLATTLRRVKVAQVAASLLVVGGFLGAAAWIWQPLDLFEGGPEKAVVSEARAGAEADHYPFTVEPQPVRETISLSGKLGPWRTVTVTSPVLGRIARVHTEPGRQVREGELLVELDVSEALQQYRKAQVEHIEKSDEFDKVKNWESSPDMAAARRAFTLARMSLEDRERQLKRSAFLLEQGLIATSQHEETERQHRRQLLDFEASREDFETARAGGGKEALDKAELELLAAEAALRQLEEGLDEGSVQAPISGVVLSGRRGAPPLEVGRTTPRNSPLLTIGDFTRLGTVAQVDEIDVVRVAVGQAVSVTGHAFPDLTLTGKVTHVASEPQGGVRGGGSRFAVRVTLDPIEPERQRRLRTGMSCMLEIVVYGKDAALMVPLEAVERHGRTYLVQVIDPETGASSEREVEVGPTTMSSVEIVAGLAAGEQVAVPAY